MSAPERIPGRSSTTAHGSKMCDSRLVPTSQCTGGGISEGSSLAGERILQLFKPWRLPVGTRLGR